MDSSSPNDDEASEQEYKMRLDSEIMEMYQKPGDTSRARWELASFCLSYHIYRGRLDIPRLPFNCDKSRSWGSALKHRHCHFTKTPSLDFWRTRQSCNLGVGVAPAKKWNRRHEAYRMQNCPRGHCIIVANVSFGGLAVERHCCIEDAMCIRGLFLALHFDCTLAINLKADEMKELLEWAAQPDQQNDADCLVVVLMSHGRQNYIYGVDFKPLHLYEDIYEQFNNENCPALQGKPKLFFVQACRGENYSGNAPNPANYDVCHMPTDAYDISHASPRLERTASWSDMYIAYATIPGFVALRNEKIGSWLISAMVKVFRSDVHNKSLDGLMRRVHALIVKLSSPNGTKQTPCTEQLGWRKKLYFYPGRT